MAVVLERRSQRVLLDVSLVVHGESKDKQPFREETFTVTVSAHGALVLMASRVELGQNVRLLNPKSWDEREARVAYLGKPHAGLAQVGIEFTQPAPEFWAMDSPPADWNLVPR
jgi:hypothetical protein